MYKIGKAPEIQIFKEPDRGSGVQKGREGTERKESS